MAGKNIVTTNTYARGIMMLYFSTPRDSLLERGRLLACRQGACGVLGHHSEHLCFTNVPLAGHGANLFTLDVPLTVVEQFEYKNPFRPTTTRFFALPRSVVENANGPKAFLEETGIAWNRFVVPVLDKRPSKIDESLIGQWALIWASREGIATAKVHRHLSGTFMSIEVTFTDEYNPEVDSVVVEQHGEHTTHIRGQLKDTFRLEVLAGLVPLWVVFPTQWNLWVWDKRVSRSAVNFLIETFPSLRADIEAAASRTSKANRARAWRAVADDMNVMMSSAQGRTVDLGVLGGHSWTKVEAMPMVIAQRLGQNLRNTEWVPPIPKPEYINPDDSGRYLLASLHGAYPTRGPGVDHQPQERRVATVAHSELPTVD